MWHVSFVASSHIHVIVLALMTCSLLQALMLSEKRRKERAAESAQAAKSVELEEMIAELLMLYADLKHEKDNVTAGYRRLVEKHNAFTVKAEQEKTELVKTHAVELSKLHGDLDMETRSYTEYRQNLRHRLRELHEMVASSFDEVNVQCLPFPGKGVKIEEMIDWVAGEVKTVSDTVWQLNDNFVVLGIEGVLNMLNDEGYQELGRLCDLAASHDAVVLQDVPKDVRKLTGQIVQKGWKPHGLPEALCRLEAAHTAMVSDADN
jgi:hypothetical protein